MICSRRSSHIPMNGKRKKSPYSAAAQLPLLQQSPSPVKKEKQRTSAEKEAVPVKKGRLQMEILKEHQNIEAMVKENTRPQRADEAVCDLQSYSAGEQGLIIRSCKTVSMWKRCICLWKLRSLTSSICYIALKIGDRKWYTISSLADFFERLAQQTYAQYGMSLAFTHSINRFDEDSQDLIRFLKNCFYEGKTLVSNPSVMEIPPPVYG